MATVVNECMAGFEPPQQLRIGHHEEWIPCDKDDSAEQVKVLLQSLAILVKLAKMDSSTYHLSLQKNRDNDKSDSVHQLQKSLDDLQTRWRLEDTPAMQLCALIHGFHGTINNLQKDAEEQAAVYHKISGQAKEYKKRNAKLERALLKINAKNQKLIAKVKQRSKEKRSLVEHVQEYVQQVKDSKKEQQVLEERSVAYQLQAHEMFLQSQQIRSQDNSILRRRCFSHDLPLTTAPRARGMSSDSNFSDLDALDFASGDSGHDRASNSFFSGDDARQVDELSCISDEESSTVSSLVTDGVEATVRLAADNPSTPTSPTNEKSKDLPVLEITFPDANSIGLQFEKVEGETSGTSMVDLIKSPLRRKQKGILNDAVIEEHAPPSPVSQGDTIDEVANENDNNNSSSNQQQLKGFHLQWNKVFGKAGSLTGVDQKARVGIFVVCGFEGFHNEPNDRPSLGATLVSINGYEVDGTWSLADLQENFAKAGSTYDADVVDEDSAIAVQTSNEEKKNSEPDQNEMEPITLGFRKDPLTKKVKERLEICGHEHVEGHAKDPSGTNKDDSCSSRSTSRFSFLKLSPGQASTSQENMQTETQRAPSPTEKEQDGTANKSEGKMSMIPKMASFFPSNNKPKNSFQESMQSPRDKEEEEEEELNVPSSRSQTKRILPLFPSTSAVPMETTTEEAQGGKGGDSQDDQNMTQGNDTVETGDANFKPNSSTNILSFLSPQKLLGKQGPSHADVGCQNDAPEQLNESDTAPEVSNEISSISAQGSKDATTSQSLCASSEIAEDGVLDSADGAESKEQNAQPTAGDKFMKNMGKMFASPFGR